MIDAFLEMYRQRLIFASVAVRLIAVVWVATVGAAQAQELGSARQGLRLARAQCAECHLVDKVAGRSSNAAAPSFERIANVPGMTSAALTAALRTSHETMPNVIIKWLVEQLKPVTTRDSAKNGNQANEQQKTVQPFDQPECCFRPRLGLDPQPTL